MKRDKSLGLLLMVLFGVSGVAILVLAWLQPMPERERILSTFIGASGLLVALSRGLLLKSVKVGTDTGPTMVKVEDKH